MLDFSEYTMLYREAWSQPSIRWLLSTVPSAMIFDDHDVHDDWNTSESWVDEMRATSWWSERITAAIATYWIYQHLGNLAPRELADDPLYAKVLSADDAAPLLREFATTADQEAGGRLWSFSRQLVGTRLVVIDGREGRVLSGGRREMIDEHQWAWLEEQLTGDYDHVLIASTVPILLAPTLHYIEAWNEAICLGAWGSMAAKLGERLRRARSRALGRVPGVISPDGGGDHGSGRRSPRPGPRDDRDARRRRAPGLPRDCRLQVISRRLERGLPGGVLSLPQSVGPA